MSFDRYQLVTVQNGNSHSSSVLLTATEAQEHLELEELLHRAAGWQVTVRDGQVFAKRGDIQRIISIHPKSEETP